MGCWRSISQQSLCHQRQRRGARYGGWQPHTRLDLWRLETGDWRLRRERNPSAGNAGATAQGSTAGLGVERNRDGVVKRATCVGVRGQRGTRSDVIELAKPLPACVGAFAYVMVLAARPSRGRRVEDVQEDAVYGGFACRLSHARCTASALLDSHFIYFHLDQFFLHSCSTPTTSDKVHLQT